MCRSKSDIHDMVQTLVIFITSFALFCSSPSSFAQGKSARLVQSEFNLENQITQHMNQVLSTQLSKDSYSVSVKVEMSEIKKSNTPTEDKSTDRENVESLVKNQLGEFDTDQLIKAYQDKLNDIQKETQSTTYEDKLKVDKISIYVGLSQNYSNTYLKEFDTWLKRYTRQTFGNQTTTQLNKINKEPEPNKSEIPENEDLKTDSKNEPSALDRLNEFQNLIGWVTFALCLLISALILRSKHKSDDQSNPAYNQLSASSSESSGEQKPSELKNEVNTFQEMDFLSRSVNQMCGKIFLACIENVSLIHKFIRYQLANEPDGDLKVACLLDAIYVTREKLIPNSNTHFNTTISLEGAFVGYENLIKQKFKSLSSKSFEERFKLYESVYWDLLSYKTLGQAQYTIYFDIMRGLTTNKHKEILDKVQNQEKLITLLLMKPDERKLIFDTLTEQEKLNLFKAFKNIHLIKEKDVTLTENNIKRLVELDSFGKDDRHSDLDLTQHAISILDDLSPAEKINTLLNAYPQFSELPEFMKNQWTFAYLNEWDSKAITLLHQSLDIESLKLLCKTNSTIAKRIIETSSSRNRVILTDEINFENERQLNLSEIEMLKNLETKVFKYLEEQGFTPKTIIAITESQTSLAKAS